MKYLLILFFLVPALSFGQCINLADSVTSNTATLITATTARINGNGDQGDVANNFIKLRYVRVGQVDTVTSTTAWPTVVRNLTGLQPGTQYVYYYSMNCGDGDVRQIGRYYFTTLSSAVVFATERSTVFPYVRTDSGFRMPRGDTSLYRATTVTGGNIMFKTSDSLPYYYNGQEWKVLAVDSAGILPALNLKVDSVTVETDSLFYWINGTAYGYILPNGDAWYRVGNSGTVADTNFIGTTDAVDLMFKRNSVEVGRFFSDKLRVDDLNKTNSYEFGSSVNYAEPSYVVSSSEWTARGLVKSEWWDGNAVVSLHDTLFTLGGWKTGPTVTDSIFYSVNNGTTWVGYAGLLPFAVHSMVVIHSPDGWIYMLGGDDYSTATQRKSVYRTRDLITWTLLTSDYGGGERILGGGFSDDFGNLYWVGGQSDVNGGALNNIYKSIDGGTTWTLAVSGISVGGSSFLGQNISNSVVYFNGRVYVVGGGVYDEATPADFTYTKKVYSADLYDLTLWKAENDLPFSGGRQYSSVSVWDGKIWCIAGYNGVANTDSAAYMSKGGDWTLFSTNTINTTHAAGVGVHNDRLFIVAGNLSNDCYMLSRGDNLSIPGDLTVTGGITGLNGRLTTPNDKQIALAHSDATGGNNDVPALRINNTSTTNSYTLLNLANGGGVATGNTDFNISTSYIAGAGLTTIGNVSNHAIDFITNNTRKGGISTGGNWDMTGNLIANGSTIRFSGIPSSAGIYSVRADGSGNLSISDTIANPVTGSGTTNYIPKWSSSTALGNSLIYSDATGVGINNAAPTVALDVVGQINGTVNTDDSSNPNLYLSNLDATGNAAIKFTTNSANGFISLLPSGDLNITPDASIILGSSITASSFSGTGTRSVLADPTGVLSTGLVTDNGTTIGIICPATTTTGLDLSSSTLTTGALATFTMTGTAAASNTKRGLVINSTGTNATASQTVTGMTINVGNLGTTNTNVGLNVTASGASTSNVAISTGGGDVQIGSPLTTNALSTSTYRSLTINSTSPGRTALQIGINNTSYGYLAAFPTVDFGESSLTLSSGASTQALLFYMGSIGEVGRFNQTTGNFGIGTGSTVSAKVHVIKTTEQLRLGYDASNYYSTTVGSTGGVTWDAVGTGAGFTFADKISVTTGSNKSAGVSGAMTAGTITISTTAVTASSLIYLTHATLGGTQGILSVGTITAGTSFVINSSSATDTGAINWWIIN